MANSPYTIFHQQAITGSKYLTFQKQIEWEICCAVMSVGPSTSCDSAPCPRGIAPRAKVFLHPSRIIHVEGKHAFICALRCGRFEDGTVQVRRLHDAGKVEGINLPLRSSTFIHPGDSLTSVFYRASTWSPILLLDSCLAKVLP